MYEIIFCLLCLACWSHFDEKKARIAVSWLLVPIVIALLWHPLDWVAVFLPVFLVLSGFQWILVKYFKQLFGIGDVLAIAFTLTLILPNKWFSILFTVFLAIQTALHKYLPNILLVKRPNSNSIRYIPILFNSVLFALIVALLLQMPV